MEESKNGEHWVLSESDGLRISDNSIDLSFCCPKYKCPKHGEVEDIINVTIKGMEANYCSICWLENCVIPNCEKVEPL